MNKIEIEKEIQELNEELTLLEPMLMDNADDEAITERVRSLKEQTEELKSKLEIINPDEEDDLERELDMEIQELNDTQKKSVPNFYKEGGQVYSGQSKMPITGEELISLANSSTINEREKSGRGEITDVDGAISVLRSKYPEYEELDASDFYEDEEMDQKFDDYALSYYKKGGKTKKYYIYEIDEYSTHASRSAENQYPLSTNDFDELIEAIRERAKKKNIPHIEIYYNESYLGSINDRDDYSFRIGRGYEHNPLKSTNKSINKQRYKDSSKTSMYSKGGELKVVEEIKILKATDKLLDEDITTLDLGPKGIAEKLEKEGIIENSKIKATTDFLTQEMKSAGFYKKGGKMDDLGNPTDPKVIEKMEEFIENEIPKLDEKIYFTDGMKRKQAKKRFYEKYEYGAYNPKFSFDFEKGGLVLSKSDKEMLMMSALLVLKEPDTSYFNKERKERLWEIVGELQQKYGWGGFIFGTMIGGYAGYKYGLTKTQRQFNDLFTSEKEFIKELKKQRKKRKTNKSEDVDYEDIFAKGGEVFKKGDKVNYLGNPGIITNVDKDAQGRIRYSVSYTSNWGQNRTKVSDIYNKDNEITKPYEKGGMISYDDYADKLGDYTELDGKRVYNEYTERYGYINDDEVRDGRRSGMASSVWVSGSRDADTGTYWKTSDTFIIEDEEYAKGGRIEGLKQEILDYDRNVFGGRKGLGNKQNYFPTDMQKSGPQRYGEIIRFFKDKGYTQAELHQALQEIDYYTYMEKGGKLYDIMEYPSGSDFTVDEEDFKKLKSKKLIYPDDETGWACNEDDYEEISELIGQEYAKGGVTVGFYDEGQKSMRFQQFDNREETKKFLEKEGMKEVKKDPKTRKEFKFYAKGGDVSSAWDKMYAKHQGDTQSDFDFREKMERYLENADNDKSEAWEKMYSDHEYSDDDWNEEDYEVIEEMDRYAKGGFLSRLFGGKPKKSEKSKKLRRYNFTYIISDKKGKPIIKGKTDSGATSRKEAQDKLKKRLQERIDDGYYEDGDKIELFTPKQYKESKYFKKGYAKGGEIPYTKEIYDQNGVLIKVGDIIKGDWKSSKGSGRYLDTIEGVVQNSKNYPVPAIAVLMKNGEVNYLQPEYDYSKSQFVLKGRSNDIDMGVEIVSKYAKGGKLKMPTKFDEDVINIYFQLQTQYGNKVPKDLTAEQVYEMANEGYSFPQYSKKASAEALRIHKSENKYAKGGEIDRRTANNIAEDFVVWNYGEGNVDYDDDEVMERFESAIEYVLDKTDSQKLLSKKDKNYLNEKIENPPTEYRRYAKGGSVYSRFNLTKSELKEKEELKKVVSKSFDWYTYKKGRAWTSSDTKKLAEKLSQNIKSLKEFPQVLNRVNIREFIDELEGYSVPKNKGINYVTESLYSYFMKGEGYEKGGVIKKGDYVEDYGDIGVVNKTSRGVAYVKFDDNSNFQPVQISELKKKGTHKGKDLYILP